MNRSKWMVAMVVATACLLVACPRESGSGTAAGVAIGGDQDGDRGGEPDGDVDMVADNGCTCDNGLVNDNPRWVIYDKDGVAVRAGFSEKVKEKFLDENGERRLDLAPDLGEEVLEPDMLAKRWYMTKVMYSMQTGQPDYTRFETEQAERGGYYLDDACLGDKVLVVGDDPLTAAGTTYVKGQWYGVWGQADYRDVDVYLAEYDDDRDEWTCRIGCGPGTEVDGDGPGGGEFGSCEYVWAWKPLPAEMVNEIEQAFPNPPYTAVWETE